MAERTVLYRIKIVNDSGNAAEASKLAKSVVDIEKKMQAERTATAKQSGTAITKAAKDAAREQEKANRDAARVAAKAQKEVEKAARDSARAQRDASREAERAAKAAAAEARKSAMEQERASKSAAREAARAAAEQERAVASVRNEHARLASVVDASGKEIHSRFKEMASGALTFGRGVAELGLLSAESSEQLVRGLVAAQGAFDVLIGGLDTYYGIVEMMQKYRLATDAAAKMTQLSAAQNVIAIRAETVATQQLALARAGATAAGGGGSVGGAVGNAVGGLSGRIAGGASRFSGAAGGAITGGAGALAAKTGASAVGGGAIATVSAGLAAVGGAAFGLVSAFKSAEAALQNGAGGGAAAGGIVDRIAGSNFNPYAWQFAFFQKLDAYRSGVLTDQRTGELEVNKFENERRRAFATNDSQTLLTSLVNKVESLSRDASLNDGGKAESLAQQRELIRNSQASILGAAQVAGDATRDQVATQLGQMELDNVRQEYELRKQIKEERVSAARESLDLALQELDAVNQQLSADKERLMSAKERFGQLNAMEQQRLIAIKQRADTQGVGSLSTEERGLLRGVGTDDAVSIASQGDLAAADAAGFDAVFGQSQRQGIQQQEALRQKMEAEIQVKQDLVVKVEADNDAILASVREQFERIQGELLPLIQQVAMEESAKAQDAIRAEFDSRQRGLPVGGRR